MMILESIILFVTLFAKCLAQYIITDLQPDVRYDERNERFDMTPFLRTQNSKQNTHYRRADLDTEIDYAQNRAREVLNDDIEAEDDELKRFIQSFHTRKNYDEVFGDELDKEEVKILDSNPMLGKRFETSQAFFEDTEEVNRDVARHLINSMRFRRLGDDNKKEYFSFHDDLKSGEKGDVGDYESKLQAFRSNSDRRMQGLVDYLHGGKTLSRRSADDPEKEILFHHAFPIDMKIKGYLQLPAL